jgi:deoxyribonuclease-4
MSVAGGVHRAFARGESVGCTTMQLFVKNANRWEGKSVSDDEVCEFDAERARTGIAPVFAHDSYLINLASPDATLWKKSIAALVDELERCELLQLDGIVCHPGAHMGAGVEHGLARIARGLDRVFTTLPGGRCRVLLETTAGSGTHLGHRFEQLARIRDSVREPDRIGYCVDTCHAFAAGYDLRSPAAVKAVIAEFDEACGLADLEVVHANDSLAPLGSHRDRHAHIGEGEIGLAGFGALVRDKRLQKVPFILETPKGESLREDKRNLEVLRDLQAGGPLRRRRALATPEWRKGRLRGAGEAGRVKGG